MIPQGWQPIGEPFVPELSPDAKAVQDFITENSIAQITRRTESAMCKALHMGIDRLQDAVYEFRKWEAIMARKPKFNKEQRAEMLRLHNGERYSVGKLANKFGCSQTAVKTALEAAKIEAEEEAMKNTGINEEFEQSVDQMIAESDTVNTEPAAEPDTLDTKIETFVPAIPDFVLYAVDCRIADLEHRLQDFADQKAMLEHDLRRLQENIESVQDEHDKLADWKLEVDP